jgi:hypothetical protein
MEICDEFLRNRIESGGIPLKLKIGEVEIHAALAMPSFYEQRAYQLA